MEKNAHISSHTISEINTLIDSHSDFLFKYALYRIQNPTVIEDLLQETFLAVLKNYKTFKGISTERTWLVSILKHKIMDYYRSLEREKNLEGRVSGSFEDGETSHRYDFPMVGKGSIPVDPAQALEQKEVMEVLGQCLEELPARQQDAFILHELEDIDTDDICNKLNISHSNFWVMMHRARSRLRICMKSKGA